MNIVLGRFYSMASLYGQVVSVSALRYAGGRVVRVVLISLVVRSIPTYVNWRYRVLSLKKRTALYGARSHVWRDVVVPLILGITPDSSLLLRPCSLVVYIGC